MKSVSFIINSCVILLGNIACAWDCPSNTECISIADSWQISPWENNFLDLWACNSNCRCAYGQMSDHDGNCISCQKTSLDHKIAIPTILSTCDEKSDQFVCEEGYFLSADDKRCKECVSHSSTCMKGKYLERCQESGEIICHDCTNAIPNETKQQYGFQSPLPACDSQLQFEMIDGEPTCALYMTPLWDHYECSIECKVNYIDLHQNNECVPCYEACSVGEYCVGGSITTCQSCMGTLESNEVWIADTSITDVPCRPTCAQGFYKSVLNGACLPCLHNICFNNSYIFMGCTEDHPGHCQLVDNVCIVGETFLYYQSFSLQAECRTCSTPVIGSTFAIANCSLTRDTVLQKCQSSCAKGYFKEQNCSMTRDIVCRECTDPLTQIGKLLIRVCGGDGDYTFTTCPEGHACDGSLTAFECISPMIAKDGICKCPHGTYLSSGTCTVVECTSGQYPHVDSGICMPCSLQIPDHSITLSNVWGPSACACESGYFIEAMIEYPIKCWPCGDLTCDEGVQYQTPCPGTQKEEPNCLCRQPVGIEDSKACTITSCEKWLDKTSSFESMVLLPPRLWNGSYWIYTEESTETIIVEDQQISDMTVIDKKTQVYVVNHNSLWVRVGGSIGMINNGLFIYGNRNFPNNKLLGMNVCRDAVEGRFWVSFVMLTTICGNVIDDNNIPVVCSNIELIELRENFNDNALCIPIPNTTLCAENMYKIWGKNIGEGIPYMHIFSITMNYATSELYMTMGQVYASKVQKYTVKYYDGDVSQEQRNEDPIIPIISQNNTITSIVWMEDRVFALMDGYLNILFETQYSGINKILRLLSKIKLVRIVSAGGILVGITRHQIYEIDLWNGFISPRYNDRNIIYIFNDFTNTIELSNFQNKVILREGITQSQCPMDQISYNQAPCSIHPCLLLKDACGDNSLRAISSTKCACIPGFFMGSSSCQLCEMGYYCPGNTNPKECPLNSVSTSGSSSILQCLCDKGYYKFQETLCISCPRGFWCYGGYMPPVKCTSESTTAVLGTDTPLDCLCKDRTYGIDCKPCANKDVCILLGYDQIPHIAAFLISGSGPIDSDRILNETCLNWGISIVYTLPWTIVQQRVGKNGKVWSWMIVVEEMPGLENEENILNKISTCMTENGFYVDGSSVYSNFKITSNVQHAVSCGLNLEWSGDASSGQQCVCIAGYERNSTTLGTTWCSPCAIGKIRNTRSLQGCVSCLDNNSHAPWMAMDHCICKDGYYMDHVLKLCTLKTMGIQGYSVLSSPFLAIPISIVFALLSILSVWLLSVL